jgi:hypothetical protein
MPMAGLLSTLVGGLTAPDDSSDGHDAGLAVVWLLVVLAVPVLAGAT